MPSENAPLSVTRNASAAKAFRVTILRGARIKLRYQNRKRPRMRSPFEVSAGCTVLDVPGSPAPIPA